MKKLILDFIETFGTEVKENEDSSYVELMMDNHRCIEFEGIKYYIPEENSFWGEDEYLIYEFLTECRGV